MTARAERLATAGFAFPTGPALFTVWAATAAIIAVLRPGELLEIALIGVAGTIAWRSLLARRPVADQLVGATCFLLPLLNTWPARVYQSLPDHMPAPFSALLGLASVAAFVLVGARTPIEWRGVPRLALVAALLWLAGGVLGTLASGDPGQSFSALWLGLAVPIVIALLVGGTLHSSEDGWRILSLVVLAATVVTAIGIAAYLLNFGPPRSPDDLVLARQLLFRPHLFQDATLGNIGHLADFALLILPAALLGATRQRSPRPVRLASIATGIGLLVVLILTLSRSALIIGAVVTIGVAISLALRREFRSSIPAFAAVGVLALVLLSPPVRSSVIQLMPAVSIASSRTPSSVIATPARFPTPGTSPGDGGGRPATTTQIGSITFQTSESSEVLRLEAVRTGITIFGEHMPWGIGPGRYQAYDPVHTASHSLFVESLTEDGFLGAFGMIALCLFLLREAVRLLTGSRRLSSDTYRLRLAGLAGSGAFLAHGIVAGAALTIGGVDVWAALLWIEVVIAGATYPERAGQ